MIGENHPRSIVGSAKRVRMERYKRVGEPWQPTLWDIYTNLGPVHYGMTFKQSAAQRVSYYAAEQTTAQDEPVPTENTAVIEALERLGDLSEIVGQFVVQENVAGEGWLVAREDDEEFEVMSSVELEKANSDTKAEPFDYTLRIWRPHPMKRSEPDSPLRSVQAQCEQLLLLNDHISATAMSRIPAGLLAVANEFSFPANAENSPDTGANADNDAFMAELIEIATIAITDPDSAARVAPNIIRGPYEMIKDGIQFIDLSREMDETFADMREELLRQIAGGINLPAEILTGLADLNHWSLWGVDESTAKHHVDPDVLQILQGLTEGYLWPYLEEAGVSNFKDFLVWRDYSDLTARPLTLEQAMKLFDDSVITAAELRSIANVADADEDIGPGDIARRAEAVGVLFRAGFTAEAILEALGLPPIAHTGVAPVTVQAEDAVDDTPEAETVDNSPPEMPENLGAAGALNLAPLERVDAELSMSIIEASESAFTRALERAGAKIRTKTKKNPQMHAAIDGVPNEMVPRQLGAKRVEQLQLTADQLLPADTFDALSQRLDRLVAQGQTDTRNIFEQLTTVRLPETDEEEDRSAAIALFVAALFTAAQARLFTESPALDPAETGEFSDDIATAQMVVDLLTMAGGGSPDLPDAPRGLALGQRTRAAFRDNGYRVEALTWKWGYYRTPRTAYEPHQSLSGRTVLDREDPRLNGYYPGDHRFCTCELVPSVLPDG